MKNISPYTCVCYWNRALGLLSRRCGQNKYFLWCLIKRCDKKEKHPGSWGKTGGGGGEGGMSGVYDWSKGKVRKGNQGATCWAAVSLVCGRLCQNTP